MMGNQPQDRSPLAPPPPLAPPRPPAQPPPLPLYRPSQAPIPVQPIYPAPSPEKRGSTAAFIAIAIAIFILVTGVVVVIGVFVQRDSTPPIASTNAPTAQANISSPPALTPRGPVAIKPQPAPVTASADPKSLAEEVDADIQQIAAAYARRDPDTLLDFFDIPRLLQEIEDRGFMPPLRPGEASGAVTGLRTGMRKNIQNPATQFIVRAKLIQVRPTGEPAEVVAFVRGWHKDGSSVRLRWSMKRTGGTWRIYDGEEMGAGLSMSALLGAAVGPEFNGRSTVLPAWVKSVRPLTLVMQDLAAHDLERAQRTLAQLDAVQFPPSLEAQKHVANGALHAMLGNYPKALSYYDRAEAIDKDMPMLWLLRAMAYNGLAQPDQALKSVRLYIDALGEDAQALTEVGLAMEAQGRITEAADAYRRGYSDDPNSFENLAGLARTLPPEDKPKLAGFIANAPHPKLAFGAVANQIVDPKVLGILNRAYGNLPQLDRDETELTYQRARYSLLADRPAEAAESLKPLLESSTGEQRRRFEWLYCRAATAAGQYEQAYLTMENRQMAFDYIAREMYQRRNATALRKVIDLHTPVYAGDYALSYYIGELLILERKYAQAVEQFAAALQRVSSAGEAQTIRARHLYARYKAGEGYLAYRDSAEKGTTFEQLAGICVAERDASLFATLLAVHRPLISDPVDRGWNEARLHYLRGEYADAVDMLMGLREPILGHDHQRFFEFRSIMIRSLIRQRRFAAARAEVRDPQNPQPAPFYDLLIAAAAKDVAAAQTLMKEFTPEEAALAYEDPDIGPALRSPEFAGVREKFPPSTPSLNGVR